MSDDLPRDRIYKNGPTIIIIMPMTGKPRANILNVLPATTFDSPGLLGLYATCWAAPMVGWDEDPELLLILYDLPSTTYVTIGV